jgi:large subunit ribosomal protein L25
MAEQATLTIQRRDVLGKRVRRLRAQGIVPANVYGHGRASRPVQFNDLEFRRLLNARGGTKVIDLREDGANEAAVVRHIEREPKTGRIQHVDFMHVEMNEKLRARIPIRLVGDAPAVRTLGGTLLHLVDTVEVECLPRDLPDALELDISSLEDFDSTLQVSDLPLPRGVTLLADSEEPVVRIAAPRAEPTPAAEQPEPQAAAAESAEAAGTQGE